MYENESLKLTTNSKCILGVNPFSLRHKPISQIEVAFKEVLQENPIIAIKWLFYIRDIRCGYGERKVFKILLRYLAKEEPSIVCELINLVPMYGRWDDLWVLLDCRKDVDSVFDSNPVYDRLIYVVANQLTEDLIGVDNGKPISLLTKWMPSINTSSKKAVYNAKLLARELGLSEENYRKMLSKLRSYIENPKVSASANGRSDVSCNKLIDGNRREYSIVLQKNNPIVININEIKNDRVVDNLNSNRYTPIENSLRLIL